MSLLAFQRLRPARHALPPSCACASAHSVHGWSSSASSAIAAASSASSSLAHAAPRSSLATPTWCSVAVVVVEAEQQGSDALAVLVDAEPGDHAVGGALVLHLQHRRACLLGTCRRAAWPRRRRSPRLRSARTNLPRRRGSSGGGGEVDRRPRRRRASPRAARAARENGCSRRSSSPSASRSNATNDAGISSASFVHAARGGVMAQLTACRSRGPCRWRRRVSPSSTARSGSCGQQRLDELGEVAGERLARCGCRARGRRRRGTRCSGSRPTSARTASRSPVAARASAWRASATTGGRTGSVTRRHSRRASATTSSSGELVLARPSRGLCARRRRARGPWRRR